MEDQARISGKLSGQSTKKPEKPDAPRDIQRKVKEVQLAFATAVTAADKQACFEFARSGTCSRGDQCQYKHYGATASGTKSAQSKGKRGECFQWQQNRECPYGNACRFTHTPKADESKPAGTSVAALKASKPPAPQVSATRSQHPRCSLWLIERWMAARVMRLLWCWHALCDR